MTEDGKIILDRTNLLYLTEVMEEAAEHIPHSVAKMGVPLTEREIFLLGHGYRMAIKGVQEIARKMPDLREIPEVSLDD